MMNVIDELVGPKVHFIVQQHQNPGEYLQWTMNLFFSSDYHNFQTTLKPVCGGVCASTEIHTILRNVTAK